MIHKNSLALLFLLLPIFPGCQSVGDYFQNRAGDLSDALQLSLGGAAFGVHAEATPLLNAGLDIWQAYGGSKQGGTFGNFNSRVPKPGEFAAYNIFFFHARGYDTDPLSHDPTVDSEFPAVHAGTITHVHELGRAFKEEKPPENLRVIRWLDVEGNAALVVGARVRISPGELMDFLAGWFFVDLGGDG